MKLVLINPVKHSTGLNNNTGQRYQPLNLACIAGLTPPNWDIILEDENWRPAAFHSDADLVGITAFTSSVNRAYSLATEYRKIGVPVVMGGIHAWARPDEAKKYVDSIIIKEAEEIWDIVLSKFSQGSVPNIIAANRLVSKFAMPNRSILDIRYQFASVQFSRGCPMHCIFCSTPEFSGRELRRQPINNVLMDLYNISQQKLFVVDDNVYGYTDIDRLLAINLFKVLALEKLNKQLVIQVSLNAVSDDEFLEVAQDAGVKLLFIGLETGDEVGLKSVGKQTNLRHTYDFSRVHAHGMAVLGAYVFGLDTDTKRTLLDRAKFMVDCGADASQMTLLTPLPGTPLYNMLLRQGRIKYTNYPNDWDRYDFTQLVHVPAGFSCESEFYDVMVEIVDFVYSNSNMKAMAQRTLDTTKSQETAAWAYFANSNYGILAKEKSKLWVHRNSGI